MVRTDDHMVDVYNEICFRCYFSIAASAYIDTLSLHDALPISQCRGFSRASASRCPPGRRSSRRLPGAPRGADRKSTRLNSSHVAISYAVICLKKQMLRPNVTSRPSINATTDLDSRPVLRAGPL